MSERASEAVEAATPGRTDAEPGAPGQDHGVPEVPVEAVSEARSPSTELVVPGIGEVVNLDEPVQVARAIDAIRDLERNLRYVKTELTAAMVHASQVAGTKTLHLEGMTVTIKSGETSSYDAEAIEIGLREAGMPEERIREIVKETVSYSVSAAKAKQAASANPAYASVIEAHKQAIETAPSVSISLAKP